MRPGCTPAPRATTSEASVAAAFVSRALATPAPASAAVTVRGSGWASLCQRPSASRPDRATVGAVSSVRRAESAVILMVLFALTA